MRKLFLTFAFLNALFQLRAQNSEQINLLKAPASPVAQLLNFAPSAIERPTDLSSLWLSVKNSSSDLTKPPNCYAVDLSLAEITKSSDLALTSLKSKNEGD